MPIANIIKLISKIKMLVTYGHPYAWLSSNMSDHVGNSVLPSKSAFGLFLTWWYFSWRVSKLVMKSTKKKRPGDA